MRSYNYIDWSFSFGVSGSDLAATISLTGSYLGVIKHIGTESSTLSSDLVEENFTIIVTNKGSNTKFDNGDIVPWTISGRTIDMNNNLSVNYIPVNNIEFFLHYL